MKIIYNSHGYTAQVSKDGACVVHRSIRMPDAEGKPNPAHLVTHVGEKLPSQDWREVRLMGCPEEIRKEIIQFYNDWLS